MGSEMCIRDRGERVERSSVDSISRDTIQKISDQIDSLGYKEDQQTPSLIESVSDDVFLRRVYLDIAGRIPTLDESNSFLESSVPSKRFDLIDRLLDSSGHVSRQFNFFADLLRVQSRNRVGPNQPFSEYVVDSLREHKPCDEFVHEMLTAEGPLMKRGNGATGYLLRDYSMPEVAMSNTIRIFLGTRLECAQCHDHPTDKWTQRQYYEMVAFFGGVAYRLGKTESNHDVELDTMVQNMEYSASMRRFMRQAMMPLRFGLRGSGTGLARLPENYQSSTSHGSEVVFAKTIYGDVEVENDTLPDNVETPPESKAPERSRHRIAKAKQIGSRKILADWMTSPDNERFATVMASRLWKQAMGSGVVEPIDNVTDGGMRDRPKLLRFLSSAFVALDFDMKQLLRAIYYSKHYQQQASRIESGDDIVNTKPLLRRMKAEQVWDSLVALIIEDVDQPRELLKPLPNYLGSLDMGDSYEKLVALTPDQFKKTVLDNIALRDGDPDYARHVFRFDSRPGVNRRHIIYRELSGNELMRASYMLSPMPAEHLLRNFGQSDREAVNNSNTEISTSQMLQFMNGFVEDKIVANDDSVLMKKLNSCDNDSDRIQVAYRSILGRAPSESESREWQSELKQFGAEAQGDLVWSLLNSTEFLFIK